MEYESDEKIFMPMVTPCSISIYASSGSGKTFLLCQMLKYKEQIFDKKIHKILFCYSSDQPIYHELKSDLQDQITFYQGLPNKEMIEDFTKNRDNNILVLDDLASSNPDSKTLCELYTIHSHHKNMSIICLFQSIFQKGSLSKLLSLNSHYQILFNFKRDKTTARILGSQILPGQLRYFMESYKLAVEGKTYGYLLIDNHPKSDSKYMLRSNIIPPNFVLIYLPSNTS